MELPPILTTLTPTEWLPAPEWMNVHYLLRAERCPRSAALRHARYATIWERPGYPDKPSIAAASGIVIHSAIGRLITELARRGCTSSSDATFCAILREFGGYSAVIADAINDVVNGLVMNPRFQPIREFFVATLRNRIPVFREGIQLQLSRLKWAALSPPLQGSHEHAPRRPRHPLAPGSHFEVELRDPLLKWKGVADLVEFAPSHCAITDFKSGGPSDDHLFQIRVYALLWLDDSELNSGAVPVTRLTLSYSSEQQEVQFSEADQIFLRSELQARTKAVRDEICGPRSKAVLSGEVCPRCDVRQLCDEYWTSARLRPEPQNGSDAQFEDAQLVLISKKGESTWLAEVQIANHISVHAELLLRWSSDHLQVLQNLKPGTIIRVMGALVSDAEGNSKVLACISNTDLIVFQGHNSDSQS